MQVVLGPDVLVNASVAPGSPPDKVVQRLLASPRGGNPTSKWVLQRVEAMLQALPSFKDEAIPEHLGRMKQLLKVMEENDHEPEAWATALVAAAKAAQAERVITDHPDLLRADTQDGVEFMSTEAWLLEQATPPPPPGG